MSLLSASCLRSSAQLVVLVTYFSIFHEAAEHRSGPLRVALHVLSLSRGLKGAQGNQVLLPVALSLLRTMRLHNWPLGWKELRANYSLKVNLFAQLLDTRVWQLNQEVRSHIKNLAARLLMYFFCQNGATWSVFTVISSSEA